MMGIAYGVLFGIMGLLLLHPTVGLPNINAHPSRFLGWLSYVTIESFGSMVVQCYWALVNSSVNVTFAKKNFGLIVAGAQIGSILGPTLATQAETIGITPLYLLGSAVMFMMVGAMYFYVEKFGVPGEAEDKKKAASGKSAEGEGILEGFYLFWEHDYVKGIFAVSSLYMVQVTVIDYMMKVLAKERYGLMYPDDPQAALRAFASFMGYFGQVRKPSNLTRVVSHLRTWVFVVTLHSKNLLFNHCSAPCFVQTTNSISFLFSLFGTGMVISRFGLTATLVAFPALMLICTLLVWLMPNIWVGRCCNSRLALHRTHQ
jgi:AAA family ATP:ADP antiporter